MNQDFLYPFTPLSLPDLITAMQLALLRTLSPDLGTAIGMSDKLVVQDSGGLCTVVVTIAPAYTTSQVRFFMFLLAATSRQAITGTGFSAGHLMTGYHLSAMTYMVTKQYIPFLCHFHYRLMMTIVVTYLLE